MISGVGVDLVEIKRMDVLLQRYGERFIRRVLCTSEIDSFRKSARPARFLAQCFAAKEAVSKALGTGLRTPVSLQQIHVDRDNYGKPVLRFLGDLQPWIRQRGITGSHLSLSDEAGLSCAVVVLERQ
jgi:holo-[acyl-carrier protein] synthase